MMVKVLAKFEVIRKLQKGKVLLRTKTHVMLWGFEEEILKNNNQQKQQLFRPLPKTVNNECWSENLDIGFVHTMTVLRLRVCDRNKLQENFRPCYGDFLCITQHM